MPEKLKFICLPTLEDGIPCKQIISSKKKAAHPKPDKFRESLYKQFQPPNTNLEIRRKMPFGVRSTIRLHDAESLMVRLTPKTPSESDDRCSISSLSTESIRIAHQLIARICRNASSTLDNAGVCATLQPETKYPQLLRDCQDTSQKFLKENHAPVCKSYAPSFGSRIQSLEKKAHSRWLTKFQQDAQFREMQKAVNHIVRQEGKARVTAAPSEDGMLQQAQWLLRKLEVMHPLSQKPGKRARKRANRIVSQRTNEQAQNQTHSNTAASGSSSQKNLQNGAPETENERKQCENAGEMGHFGICKGCDEDAPRPPSPENVFSEKTQTDKRSRDLLEETESRLYDDHETALFTTVVPLHNRASTSNHHFRNGKHFLLDSYLTEALQPAYKKRISVDASQRAATLFNAKIAKKDSLVVQYKSFIKSRDRARLQEIEGRSDEVTYMAPDRAPSLRLLIPKLSIDGKVTPIMWESKPSKAKTIDEMVKEALEKNVEPPETTDWVFDQDFADNSVDNVPSVASTAVNNTTADNDTSSADNETLAEEIRKESEKLDNRGEGPNPLQPETKRVSQAPNSQVLTQSEVLFTNSKPSSPVQLGRTAADTATSRISLNKPLDISPSALQNGTASPAQTIPFSGASPSVFIEAPDTDTLSQKPPGSHSTGSTNFPLPPDFQSLTEEPASTMSIGASQSDSHKKSLEANPEEITLEILNIPKFLQPNNDDFVSEDFFFQTKHGVRFVLPGNNDIHTYEPVIIEGTDEPHRASNDMELVAQVERNIQETKELSNHLESIIQKYGGDAYSLFSPTLGREGHKLAKTLSPRSLTKKIKGFIKRKQTAYHEP
ncbi:uncharacterized protein LOC129590151 isoform X2 [Paramacrobiotus metropolitanus]|uniref:uncharacterized protein LOC129590151 isoform X2 n=1 Tax=Paramacrobiotus metropolitanus TaxID=2943436 RepID=UPI00244658FA|nr:uncharacterized protein LOC129590151 isoform X2 [Paramacrobiotus metropolitanus]